MAKDDNVVIPAQDFTRLVKGATGHGMDVNNPDVKPTISEEKLQSMIVELKKSAGYDAQLLASVKNQTLHLKEGNIVSRQELSTSEKWLAQQSSIYKTFITSAKAKGDGGLSVKGGIKGLFKDMFTGGNVLSGMVKGLSKIGLMGNFGESISTKLDEWTEYQQEEQAKRDETQISLIHDSILQDKMSAQEIAQHLRDNGETEKRIADLLAKAEKRMSDEEMQILQEAETPEEAEATLKRKGYVGGIPEDQKESRQRIAKEFETEGYSSKEADERLARLEELKSAFLDKSTKEQEKMAKALIMKDGLGAEYKESFLQLSKDAQKETLAGLTEGIRSGAEAEAYQAEMGNQEMMSEYEASGGNREDMKAVLDELRNHGELLVGVRFHTKETSEATKHVGHILDGTEEGLEKNTAERHDEAIEHAKASTTATTTGHKDTVKQALKDRAAKELHSTKLYQQYAQGKSKLLGRLRGSTSGAAESVGAGAVGRTKASSLIPGGPGGMIGGAATGGAATGGGGAGGMLAILKNPYVLAGLAVVIGALLIWFGLKKMTSKSSDEEDREKFGERQKMLEEVKAKRDANTAKAEEIPALEQKKLEKKSAYEQASMTQGKETQAALMANNGQRSPGVIPVPGPSVVHKIPDGDLRAVAKAGVQQGSRI